MNQLSLKNEVSEAEWNARVSLAACYRLMSELGVSDLTYTHLSARVPDEPTAFLVKPEREMFNQVRASSLLKYDFAGNKLSHNTGNFSRAATIIHAGILEARPDLNAVFHTHSPANVGLSAQKCGLLPINQHALRLYARTAYHEFHGFEFEMTDRQKLVESLGDKLFLVMRNHGAVVCGHTIAEAYVEHHHFEFACRAQIAALSAGGIKELAMPSEEVIAHALLQVDKFLIKVTEESRDWEPLMKHAHATFPGFAD